MAVMNLTTYQFERGATYADHVALLNAQTKYAHTNLIQPMAFMGKCRASDLPSVHPYWRLMHHFSQMRRYKDISTQIETLRVQMNLTNDGSKISRMAGMMNKLRESQQGIRAIIDKYKIRPVYAIHAPIALAA